MTLGQTPSQTVGPYFAYGLTPQQYGYDFRSVLTPTLVQPTTPGTHIELIGQVFDGAGNTVGDAMLEIAHADADGQAITSIEQIERTGFTGFGRAGTGVEAGHHYRFRTIVPGARRAGEAPYINVILTMRGMLVHAFTRIYFEDQAANADDAVLNSVPAERRPTLIARRVESAGLPTYRFDLHMQGEQETVFFDL